MSYDWPAALVFVALFAALMVLGRLLAFRVPAGKRRSCVRLRILPQMNAD